MAIANYTTSVSAAKSIGEIQEMLCRAGASAVMFEFENEVVTDLSFRLQLGGDGSQGMISFRLPANIDKMYVHLQNCGVQRRYRTREQAARVAWRIIKDWVRAQLAIIECEQAEMVEVFLPYAQNPQTGKTVYEQYIAVGFKQLTGPK